MAFDSNDRRETRKAREKTTPQKRRIASMEIRFEKRKRESFPLLLWGLPSPAHSPSPQVPSQVIPIYAHVKFPSSMATTCNLHWGASLSLSWPRPLLPLTYLKPANIWLVPWTFKSPFLETPSRILLCSWACAHLPGHMRRATPFPSE